LYLVRAGFVQTLPSIAKPKIPKPAPTHSCAHEGKSDEILKTEPGD